MNSEPYTLNDYLRAAGVPKPAPFASKLVMPWQPRHDQVVGLNRMLANNRFGLFDDPGCVSADSPSRYPEPITAQGYLEERLREIKLK